jgi:hypothetical protein
MTKSIWQSLSRNARFSILAFFVTLAAGVFSMGALGLGIYYLVAPVLNKSIDSLAGDSAWPTMIFAGMCWSIAFLLAGGAYYYTSKWQWPATASNIIYGLVLWLWIFVVWILLLNFRIVQ